MKIDSLEDEYLYADQKRPRRSPRFSLLVLACFLALLLFQFFQGNPKNLRLGLDLRGGTTIVLQPQQSELGKVTKESITQALEILRQRVDGVGVSESEIRAEGSGDSTKIIVSVPGTTKRELVDLVGQTAKLSIRPVIFIGVNSQESKPEFPSYVSDAMRKSFASWNCPKETTSESDDVKSYLIACDQSGNSKYILDATKVDGSQVSNSLVAFDQGLGWVTNVIFDKEGSQNFGELSTNISRLSPPRNQMAIVLDGKIVVAPRVDGPLTGGQIRIYGGFTREFATNLANVLKYGALPFSFRVDEVEQISATLGASQLKSGLTAGALGLLLISIYLLIYYRALGLLAIASLAVAFAITLLLFVLLGRWIGLTLTLAGIAGAIVSIGVTADSFIVYFERVRDEMRQGGSLRSSLEKGWLRAKRTVWIADAVSLLAALILYLFTTGNVRGFAFTLGITTLIDLFIVYFFTRPLFLILERFEFFSKGHRWSGLSQSSLGIINDGARNKLLDLSALGGRLFRGESSINVVNSPKRWFLLSGSFMIASAISLAFLGLNLGIEFKGGSVNVVSASNPSTNIARDVLNGIGYEGQAVIQEIGDNKIRIETSQLSNTDATKLANGLAQAYKVDVSTIDSQNVGPSWGAEISRKALLGLFWFIVVLMLYLTFALEVRMALAAILAVIHDVFITVGLYAATGLKVTPAAVIGFLTILGYSLYDTVVVFDKVRENVLRIKRKGDDEYKKAVNLALNQTLIRSINTSVVAVIPIASILLVGAIFLKAETLKDISLALVVGQTIGTYSSIFIAAPLLVKLNAKRKNSLSSPVVSSLLTDPRSNSAINKVAESDIVLPSFVITPIQIKDAPDLFRMLFENSICWQTLWVDKALPETLEEFTSTLRAELSKSRDGNNLHLVRKSNDGGIFFLIQINKDIQNEVLSCILLANFAEESQVVRDFLSETSTFFHSHMFEKVLLWIYEVPQNDEFISNLTSVQEGKISSFVKLRDGRCNVMIYSL